MKRSILVLALMGLLLLGCQPELTVPYTPTPTSPLPYPPSDPITPVETTSSDRSPELPASVEATPIAQAYPPPEQPASIAATPTAQAYPPPEQPASIVATPTSQAFPSPEQPTSIAATPTDQAYPPPGQATSVAIPPTIQPYPPPGSQPTLTPISTQPESTPGLAMPTVTVALPTLQPTEFVPGPAGGGAGGQGLITIWLPWDGERRAAFMEVVYTFQRSYPGVLVEVQFIPPDDLLAQYEYAAYYGKGPSLLIGTSNWGSYLFDRELVEDLSPYISGEFRGSVIAPALGTGVYQGAQVSLPLAMQGTVLYRNRQIILRAAESFDDLVAAASAIDQVGVAGGLIEIGPFYSAAHLEGLGGRWMNENGQPIFNEDDYRIALDWGTLLRSFSKLGGVEVNGNQDLRWFQEGKVGYLLEESGKRNALAEAIGIENLAIDPWPAYGSGHLSGYVQADSIYLNSNARNGSPENHFYALVFIGVMMTPEVQNYLAEVGFTPSLLQAYPRDELNYQAMQALAGGTAYPAILQGSQQSVYWTAIEKLISDLSVEGADPLQALTTAYQTISDRLVENQAGNP